MVFIFNDLHDEAVAAIKGGDKEQELFSSALKEEDRNKIIALVLKFYSQKGEK